jgi:hypothetical protein
MSFRSLQHTSGSKVHLFAGIANPLRSAFRVWFPSWRLTPFGPQPVFFHTGSAPGIRPLRSCTSRQVSGRFRLGWTHIPFRPSLFPAPEGTGPARRASVPGFQPCREFRPVAGGFSTATDGHSLGVRPSRVLPENLDRDFARSPLSHFARTQPCTARPNRRPRVSIRSQSARPMDTGPRVPEDEQPS